MPDRLSQKTLRSDARDNRDRILDAARHALAHDGLDVPMREIARRAGVGPATLYRRFPTKESLFIEAFADQLNLCTVILDEALAEPDPWTGFRTLVERICELHARDRGFTAAFLSAYPQALDLTVTRTQAVRAIADLTTRAKHAGELRDDFQLDDFLLILRANSGLRAATEEASVAASRRFASLILEAFHNPARIGSGT
ncbi:TetR/AcrR family transcriptional regulator [Actinoplanes rectilineatus]|uniref:TetR/AcrR family transcriptional regulator n=1 Tax=Actinoplanes rectilineatus TaxID=113571 RepID=UPI0005F2D7A2|nr:TetR/AcrR family transcriptional regulator [Actinoplanes rectilineatus]